MTRTFTISLVSIIALTSVTPLESQHPKDSIQIKVAEPVSVDQGKEIMKQNAAEVKLSASEMKVIETTAKVKQIIDSLQNNK